MPDDSIRINCPTDGCGTFVMDRALRDRYKRTGETFYCPAGHPMSYGESTESKLRHRIEQLERELERTKRALDRRKDGIDTWYERYREECERRGDARQRLLATLDPNGPVEIAEDEWMWACRCGNRGRATFDTEAEARRAYGQHRDGDACDLDAEAVAA